MTSALIILGLFLFGGGLVGLVVAAVKKQERDRILREQAEATRKIETERVHADEEIRDLPDAELAKRLNKWVQPPPKSR